MEWFNWWHAAIVAALIVVGAFFAGWKIVEKINAPVDPYGRYER